MVLDAVSDAQQFIDVFISVYILVILIWVLASWLRLPYAFNPVQRFLHEVCDPYLRLWRRVLPSTGPLDLSPIAGILGLLVLGWVVDAVLSRLH